MHDLIIELILIGALAEVMIFMITKLLQKLISFIAGNGRRKRR